MSYTETERFVMSEKFTMNKNVYLIECRNFHSCDSVTVAVQYKNGLFVSFSSLDFPVDMPNVEKKMIADSIPSDARWIRLLNTSHSIKITPELVQSIHDLKTLGVSDSLASIMSILVHCGHDTSLSATEIYKSFVKTYELQYYSDVEFNELLMIYTDLCIKLSVSAAENIFKVLQNDFKALSRIHLDFMEINWPEECAKYVAKFSAIGLDIVRSFRMEHVKGNLEWIAPISRVISELSDERLYEVIDTASKIATGDRSAETNNGLLSKYSSSFNNSERPWISALILERYDSSTLQVADEILTSRFRLYECSVYKLIAVCEFINHQGSADTPVDWILEVS